MVYLIESYDRYCLENQDRLTVGIYSSLEKAKEVVKKLKERDDSNGYCIFEHKLDYCFELNEEEDALPL